MAEQKELTPEEKLLKVIQKGEPKVESAGKPDTDTPPESAPQDTVQAIAGTSSSGRGLQAFNRILTLAAIGFVLLACYETYLNVPAEVIPFLAGDINLDAADSFTPPATLSDTLDMFARRRILGQPPRTNTEPTAVTNAPMIGWRAYGRENLSLIGMSDVKRVLDGVEQTQREAILMDNKLKKMHFLTEGKSLILSEQDVAVSRIGESFVEFKFGEEVLTIEK